MTQPAVRPRNPVAARPVTSAAITILMAATIFFSLYVPIYARTTPKIGDFPFFYFYMLAYMPAMSIVLWLVMLLQRRLKPAAASAGSAGSVGEGEGDR